MDNSYIIPWLLFLDFQVTKSNKARFMIFFLINILNIQISIIFLRVIFFSLKFSPSSVQKINSNFCFCFLFFFVFFFLIHVVFYYFFKGVSLRFWSTRSKIFLTKKFLEVYIYTFCFDRVKFGVSSLIFKNKNSILS